MPSAVLRLALFMNIVLSITGFAQVFHEPLGAARLPRMHQVSPCSTGASRIFAISSVNNHTALIGGLGRIGWVNDSATNVEWECSPTQEAFVAAAVRSDTLMVGTEFGSVWVRLPNSEWKVVNHTFGNQILDVKVTPRGWFVLTFEGTIHQASTLFDEWKTVTLPFDIEEQRPIKFDVHDSTIVVCLTGGHWSVTNDLGAHWQLISSINLVDHPNPRLSCELLSGAAFALLKNKRGDLLTVKRVLK